MSVETWDNGPHLATINLDHVVMAFPRVKNKDEALTIVSMIDGTNILVEETYIDFCNRLIAHED